MAHNINGCEIALKPFQFCNLTEVNVSDVETQEDFNERCAAASYLGTLQAGYTDFHYLRPIWKKTTEQDALIGVGLTGIGSGKVLKLNLYEASDEVVRENKETAKRLGIKPAARTTTVKPSGTSSIVLGSSSGIHAWHSPYYIRRMRLGKDEPIYKYLAEKLPDLVEDDFYSPQNGAVVAIPQEAPTGALYRDESATALLKRSMRFNKEWVQNGHCKGVNHNNVSCTVPLKEEDWKPIGEFLWNNREDYNGISVLPYDGGTYKQAPFEEITKKKFKEMEKLLNEIDLREVIESEDLTSLQMEAACAGGVCEL